MDNTTNSAAHPNHVEKLVQKLRNITETIKAGKELDMIDTEASRSK